MMRKLAVMLSVLLVLVVHDAQASLVNLGDGTIKDTATNLIWLQDWNVNGQHGWETQKAWAEGLTFAGSDSWALPTIDDYAAMWGKTGSSFDGLGAVFTNVQYDAYWSRTEYEGASSLAWNFFAGNGFVGVGRKETLFSAVAVREDVSPIPEPEAYLLALAGLGIVAHSFNRRKV